jgi:hypothetical protein
MPRRTLTGSNQVCLTGRTGPLGSAEPARPSGASLESVARPTASDCFAVGAASSEPGPTTYPLSAPFIDRFEWSSATLVRRRPRRAEPASLHPGSLGHNCLALVGSGSTKIARAIIGSRLPGLPGFA